MRKILTALWVLGVGVEPTRVVSSERFSRPWPPPVGLPFRKMRAKKKHLTGRCFNESCCISITIQLKHPPEYLHANADYKIVEPDDTAGTAAPRWYVMVDVSFLFNYLLMVEWKSKFCHFISILLIICFDGTKVRIIFQFPKPKQPLNQLKINYLTQFLGSRIPARHQASFIHFFNWLSPNCLMLILSFLCQPFLSAYFYKKKSKKKRLNNLRRLINYTVGILF